MKKLGFIGEQPGQPKAAAAKEARERAANRWLFIIEHHYEGRDGEEFFMVTAPTLKEACRKVHGHLYHAHKEYWSENWRDLYIDITEGNQTAYGPLTLKNLTVIT